MTRPALLLTLTLLPTALWSQETTPAGVRFAHHDWELACDNTRTCRAAGYQSDDDNEQEQLPAEFGVAISIGVRNLGEMGFLVDNLMGELYASSVDHLRNRCCRLRHVT